MDELKAVDQTTVLMKDSKANDISLNTEDIEHQESLIGYGICFKNHVELHTNPYYGTDLSFTALWMNIPNQM